MFKPHKDASDIFSVMQNSPFYKKRYIIAT